MWLGLRTTNIWFHHPIHLLSYSIHVKLCSSLSPSQTSTCGDFLAWLQRKSGVEISSVLSIGNSTLGRSLFASKPIQAGDCILKVPFSVQLTPHNLLPEINSLLSEDVGNTARLAIVILVEQKKGQSSEWAPYVSSLPHAGELHSAIFWSKEELDMVRISHVYLETINQKAQIEKEFSAIKQVIDNFPQLFDDITFKDFMHAYALVSSRAWGSSEGLSMVPFADFLNHDGVSEAILLSDEHKKLSEVIADRDYAPGDQVLIRYGRFPNSTLLLDFGFTFSYNIYDEVQISLNASKDDPLCTTKLELFQKHCMPNITDAKGFEFLGNPLRIREVKSTTGKGKGIPQSLRAFARVLCATTLQELKAMEMEAAQNDGRLARRPLRDLSREIESHQILLYRISQFIGEYDTFTESMRLVNTCSTGGGKHTLRRQMAQDLLNGELRVLKSAYAWLSNYCSTLNLSLKPG